MLWGQKDGGAQRQVWVLMSMIAWGSDSGVKGRHGIDQGRQGLDYGDGPSGQG